jgi:glucose/arabinose dehydrogenase
LEYKHPSRKSIIAIVIISLTLIGSLTAIRLLFSNPISPQQGATISLENAFPNLSFNQPVGIYHAGDNSNRLFVLERAGTIRVFENSIATNTASLFLDLRDRVNSAGGEEGLLGLSFHPNYESNGYFYVDYTAANPTRTVIARYQVNGSDSNQGNRSSEYIMLQIGQPFANHKGGQLAFGPDGYLYIAMGDGGGAGDPFSNGQNRSALLGKILRIDVDHQSPNLNYSIPSDNPFVGNSQGYREEIYAYGLRNPWRFSFDPVTGIMWAGDVGQADWEEIDIIEKGKNYGWNILEGNHCYPPGTMGCNTSGLEPPIWEYSHIVGQSITGGFVYRGGRMLQLAGKYIYGDFETGVIWSLQYNNAASQVNVQLLDTNLLITSFGVDQNNELYICDFNGSVYTVYTLTP